MNWFSVDDETKWIFGFALPSAVILKTHIVNQKIAEIIDEEAVAADALIIRIVLENCLDNLPVLQPDARAEVDVHGALECQLDVLVRVELNVVLFAVGSATSAGCGAAIRVAVSSNRTSVRSG